MTYKNVRRTSLWLVAMVLALALGACDSKQKEREKELAELRQLAELDRQEMENQYAQFAQQYNEMKMTVKDDSLQMRLNEEQKRAEKLLKELKKVKSSSSAEILRLKKELATVRAVLRDYIRQVDSLQQTNLRLQEERDKARANVVMQQRENANLSNKNAELNQTVEQAAQLNATGVQLVAKKKNSRETTHAKRTKRFDVSCTIARNVTAKVGQRTVYVRVLKPNQMVLNASGKFAYEDKMIDYSAVKKVEYGGDELRVTLYVPVNEYLEKGTYRVFIFCDDEMIGSGATTLKK